MIYLKQSTASQEVALGPFVDSTDGNTEETALSIANTDVKLWKEGATSLANKNSGGATHMANGMYYIVLDATDTNTLGNLIIYVHVAGALYAKQNCVVLAAAIYDWMIGATVTNLPVNAVQWNSLTTVALPLVPTVAGRSLDVTATGAAGIDWGNIENQGNSVNLSSTIVGQVDSLSAGAIENQTFHTDTFLRNVRSGTAQAGGATSITLDAGASSVTDFYKNDLVHITAGTGAGQSRFGTAYNGTTKVLTVSTAWATNPDNTSVFVVQPFDAIVGATAPTAAQNATAVWTSLLAGSDFSTVASIGKLLKDNVDVATSTRMATYAQPTGFLAATFPATVASPTNITGATGIVLAGVTHTGAVIPTVTTTGTATNVTTVNGLAANVITAASIASSAFTSAKFATDAIDANALAASAVTEIQSGLSTLNAAGVRAAIGMASANLDTQLDAIPTASENATGLLDLASGVETSLTVRQALRLIGAATAGKASGAATSTITYRNAVNDSVDRIVATVDADGNRTNIVYTV